MGRKQKAPSHGASEPGGPYFPIDALPHSLHLSIVLLLPLIERVRCALVSKRWAALLGEPALWAEISFEGARKASVDAETLARLVRRSCGQLRSLDITADACHYIDPVNDQRGLFAVLAAEGLTSRLETLTFGDESRGPRRFMHISDAQTARELRAALPALKRATLSFYGEWREVLPAVSAFNLRGDGDVTVTMNDTGLFSSRDDESVQNLNAFATELARALACTRISTLEIGDEDVVVEDGDLGLGNARVGAAARVAAALADPANGPKEITLGKSAPLFLSAILRALSAESPLRKLGVENPSPEAVSLLAAALAPGRSTLTALDVTGVDFETAEGQSLARAISESQPISELVLRECGLLKGGSATGVATAALLRSTASLRKLGLHDERDTSGAVAVFNELFGMGQQPERLQPSRGGRSALSAVPSAAATPSAGIGATALRGLSCLALSRIALDAAGLAALGRGLRTMLGAGLESLVMSGVRLDGSTQRRSAVVWEVVDALLANVLTARLRVLFLWGLDMGDEGLRALARVLKEPSCPLEEVELGLWPAGATDKGGAGEATFPFAILVADRQLGAVMSVGTALARALRANAAESRLQRLEIDTLVHDGTSQFGQQTTREFEAALAARRQHQLGEGGAAGGGTSGGSGGDGGRAARGGPPGNSVNEEGEGPRWWGSCRKPLTVVLQGERFRKIRLTG